MAAPTYVAFLSTFPLIFFVQWRAFLLHWAPTVSFVADVHMENGRPLGWATPWRAGSKIAWAKVPASVYSS
jgi:hypothetical protein